MLEIISKADKNNLFVELPNMVSTPEINLPASDDRKFSLVEEFIEKTKFDNANIVDIDGIRVEFEKGWGLLRASKSAIVLYDGSPFYPNIDYLFEIAERENIKDIFYKNLKSIEPTISKF